MTDKEKRSCVGTIRTLMSLAYSVHGVMDSVDADNCERIIKLINSQPKPKAGKWIKTYEPNDAEPCILWMCSNCQNVERGRRSKYCPNCGSYNGGEE